MLTRIFFKDSVHQLDNFQQETGPNAEIVLNLVT